MSRQFREIPTLAPFLIVVVYSLLVVVPVSVQNFGLSMFLLALVVPVLAWYLYPLARDGIKEQIEMERVRMQQARKEIS